MSNAFYRFILYFFLLFLLFRFVLLVARLSRNSKFENTACVYFYMYVCVHVFEQSSLCYIIKNRIEVSFQ